MRHETPNQHEFRDKLIDMAEAMIDAGHQYRLDVREADQLYDAGGLRRSTVIRQSLSGLAERIDGRLPAPKLILTSPPYPGVYVNYHRWKVLGRRETPAPFWLANELDGHGIDHYTMDARADRSLDRYFKQLEAGLTDLAKIAARRTIVVQMVGFHDLKDLSRYLRTMKKAGFAEHIVPELGERGLDGRLWRGVPNRRWWTLDGTKGSHTALEVVLIHKKV